MHITVTPTDDALSTHAGAEEAIRSLEAAVGAEQEAAAGLQAEANKLEAAAAAVEKEVEANRVELLKAQTGAFCLGGVDGCVYVCMMHGHGSAY